MLIRFRVSNFLSFDAQTELSLLPGAVRSHENHVVRGESAGDIDLLKMALIYGANASGKSNLVSAMNFARSLILKGTRPDQVINLPAFKLNPASRKAPSRFEFEIKIGKQGFLYGFLADTQTVHEEYLYEFKKTTQKMLFERKTPDGKTEVQFGKGLPQQKDQRDFLRFTGMGTRPNQLFLSECNERNVDLYQQIFSWFRDTLVIVFPEMPIADFFDMTSESENRSVVEILSNFDTGICGVDYEPVDPEKEFPPNVIKQILSSINPEATKGPFFGKLSIQKGKQYRFKMDPESKTGLQMWTMRFQHQGKETALMDANEESDGTLRLLDLIPILQTGDTRNKVFVIDELDRSLHPLIAYRLIQRFLKNSGANQLIATTHAANLLDFDLLRRDEIWFMEKDREGASHMFSLEEFTPRYDLDIEKGYLFGRFGAIPVFGQAHLCEEELQDA
jgi:uncharacterized protein